jgi:hypothetical protein
MSIAWAQASDWTMPAGTVALSDWEHINRTIDWTDKRTRDS